MKFWKWLTKRPEEERLPSRCKNGPDCPCGGVGPLKSGADFAWWMGSCWTEADPYEVVRKHGDAFSREWAARPPIRPYLRAWWKAFHYALSEWRMSRRPEMRAWRKQLLKRAGR